MSTPSSSIDATSKRWLTVLAVAILASVVILTRSFLNVLSPPQEKSAEAQQPASDQMKQVHVNDQEAWSRPQHFQAVQEQPAATSFPSTASDAGMRKKNEAAAKEMVHKQAEQLRAMVRQNKLPDAYGHLTLEQIDEMEKEGVTIQ